MVGIEAKCSRVMRLGSDGVAQEAEGHGDGGGEEG